MNFIRPKNIGDLEHGEFGFVRKTLFCSKHIELKNDEEPIIKIERSAVVLDELIGNFCIQILCNEVEGKKTFSIKDYEGDIELQDLTYIDPISQDLYITLTGNYNISVKNYTEDIKKLRDESIKKENASQTIDVIENNFDETEDLINFNKSLEKFIQYILPQNKFTPENDVITIERQGSFMASMNEEVIYCTREKTEKILQTIIAHKRKHEMLSDILDDELGVEFKYYINEIWEGDYDGDFVAYNDTELELIEEIKFSYYEDKINYFEGSGDLSGYIKKDFKKAESYYGEIGNYDQAEKITEFLSNY